MTWKLSIVAFISLSLSLFPDNLIGCSPTEDPQDYFTSFFSRDLSAQNELKPFYYTSMLKFYTDEDWYQSATDSINNTDKKTIIGEWRSYCAKEPGNMEIYNLVFKASENALADLLTSGGGPLANNKMGRYLVQKKKKDALAYLLFAKQTEKYSYNSDWSDTKRDTTGISLKIAQAKALIKIKDAFLGEKYQMQVCKLTFYANQTDACIQSYLAYFGNSQSHSSSRWRALSYYAGCLYQKKSYAAAACQFSRLFQESTINKEELFMGFHWAIRELPHGIDDCLQLCLNDKEKASMIGLNSLYGTNYNLMALRKVFLLNPDCPLLPLFVCREINKVEENYLSPLIEKQRGAKEFFLYEPTPINYKRDTPQIQLMENFYEKAGAAKSKYRSVFLTGAAYLSFLKKDYINTHALINKAREVATAGNIQDQLHLISLLTIASENKNLDSALEATMLPDLKWLMGKAITSTEFALFFRNFCSEILALRYARQHQWYKSALTYGLADMRFLLKNAKDNYDDESVALSFIRHELNTDHLVKLNNLFIKVGKTPFENFLFDNNSLKISHVIDVLGTSYLRDFNFYAAIEWLQRSPAANKPITGFDGWISEDDSSKVVNVDPFYNYLNDWSRYDKPAKKPYTKLTLAKKFLELENQLLRASGNEEKVKILFQLANGYYNISYYGNAWSALNWDRSSGLGFSPKNAGWEKEYYGVFKAKSYFQKAFDLTNNSELKARCLTFIAKCAQRQIPVPDSYSDEVQNAFLLKYKNNPYFAQLQKQFGSTQYYRYVFDNCSYLRDFVKRSTR